MAKSHIILAVHLLLIQASVRTRLTNVARKEKIGALTLERFDSKLDENSVFRNEDPHCRMNYCRDDADAYQTM